MSPRKTILRELSRAGSTYTRPVAITGYSDAPDKYQKAVNELLSTRLLEGRKDEDGHMTLTINAHRQKEVMRELRPAWARPGVWAVVMLLLVMVAVGVNLT